MITSADVYYIYFKNIYGPVVENIKEKDHL